MSSCEFKTVRNEKLIIEKNLRLTYQMFNSCIQVLLPLENLKRAVHEYQSCYEKYKWKMRWPPAMNSVGVKPQQLRLFLLGVKNIQISIFMSFI
jgi:hypothetical protein